MQFGSECSLRSDGEFARFRVPRVGRPPLRIEVHVRFIQYLCLCRPENSACHTPDPE